MNAQQIRLLPCPFCGGRASFEYRGHGFIVRCDRRFLPNADDKLCPVNMRTRGGKTEAEAAEQWNTRTEAK